LLFTHSLPISSLAIGRATDFFGGCSTVAIGFMRLLRVTVLYSLKRYVNST
jgi:hypothetical protein